MSRAVSPAREAALYVLSRCRRFDAWSQQTLESARARFALEPRDAALCSRMCLAVLQNASLCDYYIGAFSSVTVREMEPAVLDILRLGTVQLLFMDRIPVSAAVNESVELAKRANQKTAGLVNAVLRRIAENADRLPAIPDPGTARELSILYSHPLWLCEKIVNERGYPFARDYFSTNNTPGALTLTANLLRTDAVHLTEKLLAAGFEASASELSGVSVKVGSGGAVTALPGYGEGEFFVQDAAAAAGILAAAPQKGMRVLDACAAPGGKSLLCAGLMEGDGEIVACDLHEKKLSRIAENASRLGIGCIRTAAMDVSSPREEFKGAFDLVIADVPCSGMGVIRKKPEIRYKDRAQLSALPEVQLRILRGCAACVRPGGTLLYSTCTVLREENEGVVNAFLSGDDRFRADSMRTIWPQEYDSDGFFYCILKKNDDSQ